VSIYHIHGSGAMIVAMRVLIVGGSGYVGGLVLPALAQRHDLRILDPRPPAIAYDYRGGDATDPAALADAMDGVDAVLHCAMGSLDDTPAGAASAFDVNVKSVHLTLRAAHDAGVPHAVHVSSLSIYRDVIDRRLDDESVPPDACDLYGLTKRLGEQVCRAAVEQWGMSVTVLRLTWPTPDGTWPAWGATEPPTLLRNTAGVPVQATAASDLARAVDAALDYRDGFQAFTISGDRSALLWSTAKAGDLLGWSPTFG
jgi:nucleoside-diphosphate-sugar epimerase